MSAKTQKITAHITREIVAPGIYRYVSVRAKIGWTKDKRNGSYFCYGIDFMLPVPGRDQNGKPKRIRHREKPIASKDAAETILSNLKLRQQERKYDVVLTARSEATLEQLFDAVIPTLEVQNENRRALRVQKHFREILPPHYLITEVSLADTFNYAEKRRKEGATKSTTLREITTFSAILHKAPLFFKTLKNWQCPKIFRPDVSGTGRQRVWSAEERTTLLNYLLDENHLHWEKPQNYLARRRAGLTLYFSLMTSLRHGDVCKIKKSWWDKKANRLQVKHAKTETFTIYQPVPETIAWILNEAEALHPDSDYFFSTRGKVHNKTYSTLKRICSVEHLDLPYGRHVADGFVIHDLRHTTTTVLGQNRIDADTTKGITGHKTIKRVSEYTHSSSKSRAEALSVIERELSLDRNKKKTEKLTVEELFERIRTGAMNEAEFARLFPEIA